MSCKAARRRENAQEARHSSPPLYIVHAPAPGHFFDRLRGNPKVQPDRKAAQTGSNAGRSMASASPHATPTPTGHDMTPRDAKRLRVAFDGTPERRRARAPAVSTRRRPLRRQNAVVVEEPDSGAAAVAAAIEAAAAEAT